MTQTTHLPARHADTLEMDDLSRWMNNQMVLVCYTRTKSFWVTMSGGYIVRTSRRSISYPANETLSAVRFYNDAA